MADDSTVRVRFVGVVSDLKSSIGSVSDSLSGVTEKFGAAAAASTALAATAAVTFLIDASKAAQDDARSQFTLAQAIKNNTDATAEGIAGAEAYISKLSNAAAVADDELRPALATLVRSTHDVATAQQLLGLATDVAAGTGRDLGTVADALTKAYEGNTKSLKLLAPEITGLIKEGATAGEVFDELARTYSGSAEGLADVSPWQRMNIQIGEAAEKIGVALLPTLEVLAESLEEDIGPALEDLAPIIEVTGKLFAAAAGPLIASAEAVQTLADGVSWLGDKLGLASDDADDNADAMEGAGGAAAVTNATFKALTQSTVSMSSSFDAAAANAKSTAERLRDLKSATFDLPDAQRSVADGWDAIDEAAKSAGGSMRDVEQDMRNIRDASEGLEEAQRSLLRAEQDLLEARKPASARTVAQAERDVTESLIKRAQAVNKVGEIEAKIKNVPKDGSAESYDEITKANLELELAKLGVKKAYEDAEVAAEDLNRIMQIGKEGTDAVVDAERELEMAQRGVRDATESVADAQKAALEPGAAHEDKTKAIAAAYETQKKNIWETVEAMAEQGKSQQEIDAFIEASGEKLDEYANKYKLAKGDVDRFKESLDLLAISTDPARLGAATAGNLVPPAWTQAGLGEAKPSLERFTARVVVPLIVNARQLAEAVIDLDRGYN